MHFEVPELPHSVKEFFAHYVMIVVSILTALGLESALQYFHHRLAAGAAQQAMDSELRNNLDDLRGTIAANAKRLKALDEFSELLFKDFDDGVPEAQIRQQITEHVKAGVDVGLFYPKLRHEAWDVAVANQSASYLPPESLRRLSIAYAAQRDVNLTNLTLFVNLPAFMDALTDARVGAADPHAFLRAIRQATLTVHGINQKLDVLEQDLAQALPAPPATDAASGKAALRIPVAASQ